MWGYAISSLTSVGVKMLTTGCIANAYSNRAFLVKCYATIIDFLFIELNENLPGYSPRIIENYEEETHLYRC